ncbi:chromosomes protein 5 structural maintenance [Nannizzia gypsea CBS 118893]|uniref:Structural maintenance of chromosomes protein 5 n=1 Tax=Arthroderma gypseum (strain ATCC MYA-4604 / CBS 118893) TaxID=535722 RepID=E5QY97_ARTGP|nr:chromosomes protein 5 structural maintenance [Nannizzia gypsea CBS 118893]EFQ97189.1 chromosomes protein 5 structural maintenance [Nannizzia gypsea CBS 118893]
MPDTLAPPKRRQRAAESDSDDDEASNRDRDGTPLSHASNGSKRVKLTTGRDDHESEASEETSLEEDDSDEDRKDETLVMGGLGDTFENVASSSNERHGGSNNQGKGNAGAGGKGLEHLPGSIVRVKLTNFVTYTSAECHPGPRLNMVIGPNGTGKSTFVCAICLGLGWGPAYLGRAKDVAEFVKHGADEAIIEIELKAREGMNQNPIICRTIKREGNKSTFTINGQSVRQNVVLSLAKSFSIQIDNLCQFLPQDKVSEFAALSPVELLHSTQRAAAGPEMAKWHDDLKELRSGQKDILEESASQREHLANLEKRQQMQREDVERMKQREEVKKRLKFLEMLRPLPRFNSCRRESSAILEQKQRLMREQEELKQKLEPALRAVNSKRDYYTQVEAVLRQKRLSSQNGEEAAAAISEKLIQVDDKIKDLSNQINAEKKSGSSQLEECKKIQQSINRLQRQMEEEAVDFDAAAYNEKIRDCVRRTREIQDKAMEIQTRKKTTILQVETHRKQIANAEQRLIDLKSQSGQQEEKLKRLSEHSFRAWEWIKQNQDRFEKHVFGPPIVECSVKDPKYASAAESLLQRNDFMAFTTQSRADFRTLQRALNNDLGLHDISIKTCTVSLSSMSPPVTDEELRSLNFDGWVKDFMDGPEPVLAMLCSENRFHSTAVTLRDISDEEYRRLEKGNITTWIAGNQNYQVIRRREYGPSASTTRVRQLWPARMWTDKPVDSSSTEKDLMNCVTQWKAELSEILASGAEERDTLQRLKEERDAVLGEKTTLEKEKAEKQSALVNYRALPTKLAQQKEKLKTYNMRVEGIRDRVESLREKQDELAVEKAGVAIEYSAAVVSLSNILEDVARVEILAIEAMSDLNTLQERNAGYTRELNEKAVAVEEVIRNLNEMREKLRASQAEVRAVVARMHSTPGLKEVGEEIKNHTIEQLEADIDSEKARLELTHEGSSNVIQEFEEREVRIEQLREQLSSSEERLAAIEQSIKEIRSEWEPRLDAIVAKISDAFADNFARIGCAGQVSVDKNEDVGNDIGPGSDFDQWSIRIQVKFREHEALSILDSHRQSGGERAVSTIFYLMALQSLSASPFRVVDEINQGMDPRNERMVHERMVDIACGQADSGTTGGQYFLITPKLLGGLVYKPGMTVLCIFSGEFMPDDYQQLDFKRCVLRMKQVKAQQGMSEKSRGKRAMVG